MGSSAAPTIFERGITGTLHTLGRVTAPLDGTRSGVGVARNTGRGTRAAAEPPRTRPYPETTWIKSFRSPGIFAELRANGGATPNRGRK